MSLADECGPALILVYEQGRRVASLAHGQDGGEAYMGPLLRKAVQYAKTHYDSGNIVDVLMSEGSMSRIADIDAEMAAGSVDAKHVYYVTYRWNAGASKTYHVHARHMAPGRNAGVTDIPEWQRDMPDGTSKLV